MPSPLGGGDPRRHYHERPLGVQQRPASELAELRESFAVVALPPGGGMGLTVAGAGPRESIEAGLRESYLETAENPGSVARLHSAFGGGEVPPAAVRRMVEERLRALPGDNGAGARQLMEDYARALGERHLQARFSPYGPAAEIALASAPFGPAVVAGRHLAGPSVEVVVRDDAPPGSAARFFDRLARLQHEAATLTALPGGEPPPVVTMSQSDYAALQIQALEAVNRQHAAAMLGASYGRGAGLVNRPPPRRPGPRSEPRCARCGGARVAACVECVWSAADQLWVGKGDPRAAGPGACCWDCDGDVEFAWEEVAVGEDEMLEGTVE